MKLFPIVLSLLVLTPAGAFAQAVTSRIVVSYGDLNLGSEAGVKTLDSRLANAIRTVCGAHDGSVVPERRLAAAACVREKSAQVAAQRARAIADYSVSLASR